MLTFLSNLLGRSSSPRRRTPSRPVARRIEWLEDRRMMSVNAYVSSTTGELTIFADQYVPTSVSVTPQSNGEAPIDCRWCWHSAERWPVVDRRHR